MCGIAGLLQADGVAADPELLRRMISSIQHRGPDDCGVYTHLGTGLAHARLSVIDLESGHQPLANEDGSVWITFNGEIFNYVELREELQRRGHVFATESDTEVIVHLYEEEGEDCVRRLRGQWAFAIWDARTRQLFLSRDRVGIRPLFWTTVGSSFVFASEIKALLVHPGVPRELDLVALDQIFSFWVPLPPRTAFRDIRELPPGCSMVLRDAWLIKHQHWCADFGHRRQDGRPEIEYVEELREHLVDATRVRLRSDVPVGAYLSGGLDSTLIAAIIQRYTDSPLRTFSVTFEDEEFDESGYQEEAVAHLGTEHQTVHCSRDDVRRVFPEVIWHAEKPLLRTGPAPLFLLSGLVHDMGYKVVVTGEGSDEVLGGYDIFKEAKIREFWGHCPESTWRPLLLKRLYPYMKSIQSQPAAYLQAFFRVRPEDLSSPFFSHLPRWALTERLKVFFSDAVRAEIGDGDGLAQVESLLPGEYGQWGHFCQAQYLEMTQLLPGYILSSQGDRVAMAHSVEGRFPFLDSRVIDFAASIPPELKMMGLNEKYLLKRCAEGLVPDRIRKRPKQPYRAPDGVSFLSADGRGSGDYVEELLSPARLRQAGLFNPVAVERLVQKAKKGQLVSTRDNMALVGILSTQLIDELFIRNPREAPTGAMV